MVEAQTQQTSAASGESSEKVQSLVTHCQRSVRHNRLPPKPGSNRARYNTTTSSDEQRAAPRCRGLAVWTCVQQHKGTSAVKASAPIKRGQTWARRPSALECISQVSLFTFMFLLISPQQRGARAPPHAGTLAHTRRHTHAQKRKGESDREEQDTPRIFIDDHSTDVPQPTFATHDQSAPRPPACTSTLAHTGTPSAHARRTPTSTPPQCRHSSRPPPPPPPHVVGVTTLLSDVHTSHGSVALCAATSPASWRISPHRRIHFHSTPSTTDHL